jgi:hypothetical protein
MNAWAEDIIKFYNCAISVNGAIKPGPGKDGFTISESAYEKYRLSLH